MSGSRFLYKVNNGSKIFCDDRYINVKLNYKEQNNNLHDLMRLH